MSNQVFVLDKNKKPLMPCHPARARQLLRDQKAAVYRCIPFTIILKEQEGGNVQPVAFKVDPGSKTSGIAIVAGFAKRGPTVVFAAEIQHRGQTVKSVLDARRAIRRNRRQRKTRYRQPRFQNRRRPEGWLPPSLRSRIDNITTWLDRFRSRAPVSSIGFELVKFDTQALENPEVSGVEYQQGTLKGYEVREYLLEKFKRTCAYCKRTSVPLQVEHIVPRSRGGVNSVRNLTLACQRCNQRKGNKTASEFGHPEVEKLAKAPLRDAAAVNTLRRRLFKELRSTGLPVECGSGGRTKFNRTTQGYLKAHWIDAACVGVSGEAVGLDPNVIPLRIRAMGRGHRQSCRTNQFGFPVQHRLRQRRSYGFQTGDRVRASIPTGKYAGKHVGRVTIRNRPSFGLNGFGVHPNRLTLLMRADGYDYFLEAAIPPSSKVDGPLAEF